jgi:alternate signal-mediated exported protein
MKKSTKGALAAGGAAVLLLGGAGSLAYWTAGSTVGGGTISSGHLKLTDTTEGGCAGAGWVLDSGEDAKGVAFTPATMKLVPGDVLTKTCTFTVDAVGEHLRATASVTGGAASGQLAPFLTVTGSFTKADGSTVTAITEQDDAATLTARITVAFNGSSDNASSDVAADLSAYTVTLTQAHA